VFWACGVTPQNAIRQARPAFCITHAPGHMLIADTGEFAPVGAFAGSGSAASEPPIPSPEFSTTERTSK
jgi:hypothetical protein